MAKILKELRKQKGLLQRHLIYAFDMGTPMYSRIERGERKAKREQVVLLAKFLETDKTSLI